MKELQLEFLKKEENEKYKRSAGVQRIHLHEKDEQEKEINFQDLKCSETFI